MLETSASLSNRKVIRNHGRGGVKIFQWMNFFFSANCLHDFFFTDVKALHDFFFDSTSFNVKEMQSFAQFNYSTAEGGSLWSLDFREIRVSRLSRKK